MTDTPNIAINSASLLNIKEQFAKNGFRFAEGKLRRDLWRVFGLTRGCTIELVAPISEDVVSQATIVAVLAANDTDLAFLNGRRMAALMALLAGQEGVDWAHRNILEVTTPKQVSVVEDAIGEWSIRLMYNRRKSLITLRAKRLE